MNFKLDVSLSGELVVYLDTTGHEADTIVDERLAGV